MSRNIPARTAVVAVTVAVLAVALLLGLTLWGKHAQDEQGEGGAMKVPAGFTAIDADKIFETIADAQADAGSWQVTTLAQVQGQEQASNVVQVERRGDVQAFRIQMPNPAGGVLEGLWDGTTFFEKNPQGSGATTWYSYPAGTFNAEALNRLSTDVAGLQEGFTTIEAKVVGTEVITDLQDREVKTVKYRVILEPSEDAAAPGVDPTVQRVQIELWLDSKNRPVQLQSAAPTSGSETTTYYSDYGKSFDIQAPSADQVTERKLETQDAQ
ncbi:hypothetical protein ACLM5J_01945 [Nocardioides sp. Bht2]|uniref:hypothetical protein n=1 Tax=Nocardioides sp. Bht2 TaxID=3392297 RepID=UPI0039B64911